MHAVRIPPALATLMPALLVAGLIGCQSLPPAACDNTDGALDNAAFVFVTSPTVGQRVGPGFVVSGCSRTFESNFVWRLLARDGSELASGYATGGGVDGHAAFSFTVPYSIAERQIGHLEVFEEDVADGEGFPPGRNVVPLVLMPGG